MSQSVQDKAAYKTAAATSDHFTVRQTQMTSRCISANINLLHVMNHVTAERLLF